MLADLQDMEILVSVIMPVYNGQRFVVKAIESLLRQDIEAWELIIVNDGSTDGTAEILASLTDARIRVLHQHNQGEAVARNRGLDAARGKYIAFLDADDLYLSGAFREMTTYLNAHPEVDSIRSDGYFCDSNDRPLGRLSEIRSGSFTGNILESLILDPTVVNFPICTMTRNTTIKESGVRFDPALIIGPDWDFWIHLARCARFGYLDRLTCMYRVHQTNITKTSGAVRRNQDLVRSRLKVMNSHWFQDLSLTTRREFFYNLLIGLLASVPEQQDAILSATPFLLLPTEVRADLLRLIAGNHLTQNQNIGFAKKCLQQSLALQPSSRKGRLMLQLANRSPVLVAVVLSTWRVAHNTQVRTRSLGRRKPKPVPAALLPASE